MVGMAIMVQCSHCTSPQSATFHSEPDQGAVWSDFIHILDDRVCVFIPVDIRHTVFWLAAKIYGIYAVAFWLEDKCAPQDALIGWKDLWIMQFCIPDAMHKQQQLCAAYKRQNSLFSSNAACASCCETSWRILCSATPLSLKVQVWGQSATCQKWLQFPQFGQGSLNYFQCGSSLARIRGSGNPPSLQLGHPGISLKNNNKMCS